jgi:hypothetical protein
MKHEFHRFRFENIRILDDSSIFNFFPEKIILLCPISPDFREGGSEQISEGAQETAERRFLFNTTPRVHSPHQGASQGAAQAASVCQKLPTDDAQHCVLRGFVYFKV